MYVIWLVPALLVTLYEARLSRRPILSGLATATFWTTAIVTYYLYYAGLMLLGYGGPQLNIEIGASSWAEIWHDWEPLWLSIFTDLQQWGLIAVVGGFAIGWVVGVICNRAITFRARNAASQ
jgi:hypothetical protein